MRIWDVSPGYLNRGSLLGEHRELHGIVSILVHGKRGYARHPETRRWVGCLSGLVRRHAQLVAEMRLRGYTHLSPIDSQARPPRWPPTFVTPPCEQYALLAAKYEGREPGRIPLPRSAQELWAQHKYSVLARDPAVYEVLGRRVAAMRRGAGLASIAEELVLALRTTPPRERLRNAVEHMWGYVSQAASPHEEQTARRSVAGMLRSVCSVAMRIQEPYLRGSTALSDLAVHVHARA